MGDSESESVRWSRAHLTGGETGHQARGARREFLLFFFFEWGGEVIFWNRQFIYVSNPNFFGTLL